MFILGSVTLTQLQGHMKVETKVIFSWFENKLALLFLFIFPFMTVFSSMPQNFIALYFSSSSTTSSLLKCFANVHAFEVHRIRPATQILTAFVLCFVSLFIMGCMTLLFCSVD